MIPYEFNGAIHYYNPDFEIDDKIYEIKGWLTGRAKIKLKAAESQGHAIILIDKKEIKQYIEYVKKYRKINPVKQYEMLYDSRVFL